MDSRQQYPQQYPPQYYQQQGYAPAQEQQLPQSRDAYQRPPARGGGMRHAQPQPQQAQGQTQDEDALANKRHGRAELCTVFAVICAGLSVLVGTVLPPLVYWIAYPAGIALGAIGITWARPGSCYRWMSLASLVVCAVMMVGLANMAWLGSLFV